jgi:hypothetical protein
MYYLSISTAWATVNWKFSQPAPDSKDPPGGRGNRPNILSQIGKCSKIATPARAVCVRQLGVASRYVQLHSGAVIPILQGFASLETETFSRARELIPKVSQRAKAKRPRVGGFRTLSRGSDLTHSVAAFDSERP